MRLTSTTFHAIRKPLASIRSKRFYRNGAIGERQTPMDTPRICAERENLGGRQTIGDTMLLVG
jgi:hypothetical protein